MLFSEETLDEELISEIEGLLAAHLAEVGPHQYKLDVDWKKYLLMAKVHRVYTIRENKKLIGYSSYIISNNLHHKYILMANNDSLYIKPEYRKGTGRDFINFCNGRLAEEKIDTTTLTVRKEFDFSKMLLELGYEMEETIYSKRL